MRRNPPPPPNVVMMHDNAYEEDYMAMHQNQRLPPMSYETGTGFSITSDGAIGFSHDIENRLAAVNLSSTIQQAAPATVASLKDAPENNTLASKIRCNRDAFERMEITCESIVVPGFEGEDFEHSDYDEDEAEEHATLGAMMYTGVKHHGDKALVKSDTYAEHAGKASKKKVKEEIKAIIKGDQRPGYIDEKKHSEKETTKERMKDRKDKVRKHEYEDEEDPGNNDPKTETQSSIGGGIYDDGRDFGYDSNGNHIFSGQLFDNFGDTGGTMSLGGEYMMTGAPATPYIEAFAANAMKALAKYDNPKEKKFQDALAKTTQEERNINNKIVEAAKSALAKYFVRKAYFQMVNTTKKPGEKRNRIVNIFAAHDAADYWGSKGNTTMRACAEMLKPHVNQILEEWNSMHPDYKELKSVFNVYSHISSKYPAITATLMKRYATAANAVQQQYIDGYEHSPLKNGRLSEQERDFFMSKVLKKRLGNAKVKHFAAPFEDGGEFSGLSTASAMGGSNDMLKCSCKEPVPMSMEDYHTFTGGKLSGQFIDLIKEIKAQSPKNTVGKQTKKNGRNAPNNQGNKGAASGNKGNQNPHMHAHGAQPQHNHQNHPQQHQGYYYGQPRNYTMVGQAPRGRGGRGRFVQKGWRVPRHLRGRWHAEQIPDMQPVFPAAPVQAGYPLYTYPVTY